VEDFEEGYSLSFVNDGDEFVPARTTVSRARKCPRLAIFGYAAWRLCLPFLCLPQGPGGQCQTILEALSFASEFPYGQLALMESITWRRLAQKTFSSLSCARVSDSFRVDPFLFRCFALGFDLTWGRRWRVEIAVERMAPSLARLLSEGDPDRRRMVSIGLRLRCGRGALFRIGLSRLLDFLRLDDVLRRLFGSQLVVELRVVSGRVGGKSIFHCRSGPDSS